MSAVPCNGCTLCCERDLIILHPELGDDLAAYETMAVHHPLTGQPAVALRHKNGPAGGGCVYLEPGIGCTIHGRAPVICREFDCRKLALKFRNKADRRQAVAAGMMTKAVLQAGFNRLHTLDEDER
jgi:hypothetical protein